MQQVIDGVDAALRGVHRLNEPLALVQEGTLGLAHTPLLARAPRLPGALGVTGALAQAPLYVTRQITHCSPSRCDPS